MMFITDDNSSYEESKSITGKVVYVKKEEDKTTIDVKDKKKYRVTIYDDLNLKYGQYVRVTGLFKTPDDNTVFNLFNYRKYLLSKNVKEVCYDCSVELIKDNKNVFYGIKNAVINHVDNYKSKSYLMAFVVGDTTLFNDDVKNAYANIGISHLLAVSSSHVSVFIMVINFFFKKSKLRDWILFSFLFFFLFLTGFTDSLVRCLLFMVLSFFNKRFKLKLSPVVLIMLTASLLFIINPYLVYSVGLMFSIIITFYIILIKDKLKGKNYVSKTLVISVISFLASVPVLAYNFFKVNFLSVLFNVFFVPVVSLFVFPLSLVTFIFPFLDNFYFTLVSALDLAVLFLDGFKVLSFALAKPNLFVIGLYYLSLYLSIKIDKRWIISYFIILVINVNARFLILSTTVTFLDVGQADSILITLPAGKSVLVDTGGNFLNTSSVAVNKIIPYLNSRGINEINLLILTHGDYDHMGQAVSLVNNINVKNVIFNRGEYNELEMELISLLEDKRIKYYQNVIDLDVSGIRMHFLNNKVYDDENSNSIVLYFMINNFRFLLMADADAKVENDVLKSYDLSDIDVLKVGHHGSKTSSSKTFIDSINPKYSVISVGADNGYGHPSFTTLENLSNSKVYRTDQDGSVEIKIYKNGFKIKTCPPWKEK